MFDKGKTHAHAHIQEHSHIEWETCMFLVEVFGAVYDFISASLHSHYNGYIFVRSLVRSSLAHLR